MSGSLWLEERSRPVDSRRFRGAPDAIVVGGGVTGCSCALALARGGLRVRLLEARQIASGASGRNGGFALRGGADAYDVAREKLGPERARALWRVTEGALARLASRAGDAFRRTGSLRIAASPAERERIRREFEALRADGFGVHWRDELDPPLGKHFHGGLFNPDDGALQPARWVRRLAGRAAEAGVELCEERRVDSLERLDAGHVVIATDGYTHGLLPELDRAVRPTRGQVVATEPLPRRLFDCPVYARDGYDYWQQLPDRRLVLGGFRDLAVDKEFTAVEATTPIVQGALERFLGRLLGEVPTITHRWAGIFGTTVDRLPLAGPVPAREGLWVACGYSGHGNVLGLACGELVAGAILGSPAAELELFDPARVLG